MNKKILIILLILTVVSSFVLTSCGEKEEEYYETYYDAYKLEDYVTLYDYSTFVYEEPVIEVTDDELDSLLEEKLSQTATETQVQSGVAKDGDKVEISFNGVLEDGTTVDGMNSDSYTLTIGTTPMIDGFTDSIIGKKVGEEYSVDLTFPDPYTNNTDLSGKGVTFTICVKSIFVKELPEFTEDWVKTNSEFKTTDEYLESLKEEITATKTEEALNLAKQDLFVKIKDNSEVSEAIPDIVQKEIHVVETMLKAQAEASGVEWDQFLQENMNMTAEEYSSTIQTEAEDIVKLDMVLYAACQKEGIKVLKSEIDELKDSMLTYAGMTEEQFEASYGVTSYEFIHYMSYDYQLYATKLLDKLVNAEA